jgi:hypothetical protein
MAALTRYMRAGCLVATGLACLCACLPPLGCARKPPEDPEAHVRLLLHLRDLQHNQNYKEMESLVDPSRARVLIDTLMAMDHLLLATTQLQQTAEQRLGPRAAVVCNLASLADYLGPFSRNVQIVSTRIDGDAATITYQVGERVPVERARIHRVSGQWRYMPDEPDYVLPTLLRQLTDAMLHLRSQTEAGDYTEPTFIEEYTRQVVTPLQTHLEKPAAQR